MSDIKTIDEMKTILEINDHAEEHIERKRQRNSTTNTGEASLENAMECTEGNDKKNHSTNGTEEPKQGESSQNNPHIIELVDDNSMVIKIPNLKRIRRKRPATPVDIVVSISSENESSADEVDVEF